MSKKNFIALADAIKQHHKAFGGFGETFTDLHLDTLADFCKEQNPAFNRERWIAYVKGECGPNGGAIRNQ